MKNRILILFTTGILLLGCALALNAAENEKQAKSAWTKLELYKDWSNNILATSKFANKEDMEIYVQTKNASEEALKLSQKALERNNKFDKSWTNLTESQKQNFVREILKMNNDQKSILNDIEDQKNIIINYANAKPTNQT